LSMVYSRKALAEAIRSLKDGGIDGIVVGSTSYMLYLGFKEFEDDLDIFVTSISPTFEEDLIRELASKLGCFVGQTEWGTPQLSCSFSGESITIELYENMYDFYIPEGFVASAKEYRVGGVEVKALRIDHYIILKAKAGREKDLEDLNYLADLIKAGKIRVNTRSLKDYLSEFEDYEAKLIVKRLNKAGIKVSLS